jgi:hypothetical protein
LFGTFFSFLDAGISNFSPHKTGKSIHGPVDFSYFTFWRKQNITEKKKKMQ